MALNTNLEDGRFDTPTTKEVMVYTPTYSVATLVLAASGISQPV